MNKVQEINFTPRVVKVLDVAKQRCLENHCLEITDDFLLHGVLFSESSIVNAAFNALKVNINELAEKLSKTLPSGKKKFAKEDIQFSDAATTIINNSYKISASFNQNYTGVEHLFLSILRHSDIVKKFLKKQSIDIGFLADKIEKECSTIANPIKKPVSRPSESQKQSAIAQYCIDFSKKAESGEFDHIFFRDKEVAQMSEILCRKQKRNPILIGEAGVGKSAVVGLIAKNITLGTCTEFLLNKKIYQLDLTALIAGTKLRGEFEERLAKVLSEAKAQKNLILFIDEIHNIIGMGNDAGQMDAANMLKPYFTDEDLSFIGATTQKEYEKYFQRDEAMNRRFESVFIREPNKEETFEILKHVRGFYENFHRMYYPDSVLTDIINVCDKYMTSRRFPDKAIDLLDQVGSKVKIRVFARPEELRVMENLILEFEKNAPSDVKEKHLTEIVKDYEDKCDQWIESIKNKKFKAKTKDVYNALSDKIGQTIEAQGDNDGLKNIFSNLKKHVFGQDEALKKISDCVLRSSFGLSQSNRPLGNFMFIGPTGSGKTHLARSLAKQAFGSEANLVRIDMSEFMESHSVSKLIGAPPGYVGHGGGNILSSQLDKYPSSVFLFDEIEKAHPDVVNVLLQIMDNGYVTDGVGRKLNFRNCIIVMTGNVGFQFHDNKRMGFGAISNPKPNKEGVMDNLKKFFRPEFLARLNEIVIFDELSEESLTKVAQAELNQIAASLEKNNTKISFSPEIVNFIVDKTRDSNTGARKVIFFVENELKTKIVDILSTSNYNHIKVSIKDGQIHVDGKNKKLLATHSQKQ